MPSCRTRGRGVVRGAGVLISVSFQDTPGVVGDRLPAPGVAALKGVQEAVEEAIGLEGDIRTKSARLRYLRNMAKEQEEGIEDEDSQNCILCKCEFTRGLITQWYASDLRLGYFS